MEIECSELEESQMPNLMRLLSGVIALIRADSDILEKNRELIHRQSVDSRELQELRNRLRRAESRNRLRRAESQNRLRRAESMSDAERGNEHAAELDRVRSILHRFGFSVSRSQVASAVEDLSTHFKQHKS